MSKGRHIIMYHVATAMLFVLAFLLPDSAAAQKEKKDIKEGNDYYDQKKYADAEKSYKKALSINKNSYKGSFNLGDAYYRQGKYEEAAEQFQALTHRETSKDTLAKAYHNLGNALLRSKKYQESVDAYKNALKNNPNDDDTRYNLACAQQYLKQQQQQQQQNKDNKDKNDKNKDQNKNKKDQDKKDKKDQDKKDKQDQKKDKQDQQKQEQQKSQISKEDAQRLLDALQNDEKNLQDKIKKEKARGVKAEIEKDW